MNSGYCLHHIASSVYFFRLDYRNTCHNNLNMIINELTSMWNNSKRHTWQRLVCALVNCESKARILQTALAAIWIPRRASFLSISSSVRWCSMSLTGKHHKIDTYGISVYRLFKDQLMAIQGKLLSYIDLIIIILLSLCFHIKTDIMI